MPIIKLAIKVQIAHCLNCHKLPTGYIIAHYAQHVRVNKSLPAQPAPLHDYCLPTMELVAVDILKVPQSSQGNQYILVPEDYFSKWPFAQSKPDQKADRIVKILRNRVFTLVGPPKQLHSDQGQNFESHNLSEL